jgi:hypothetical protein
MTGYGEYKIIPDRMEIPDDAFPFVPEQSYPTIPDEAYPPCKFIFPGILL